jgi:DNA invertase Pin-like site-specific DNA recombinase
MKTKSSGRLVGYARVSTNGQELRLQTDALAKAGVSRRLIFVDKISSAKSTRPGLDACLNELREGDILIAWRLDRLGRSVRHLIDLIDQLRQRKVGFKSLCDGAIDTTSASGKLIFHIFTALAEFERSLIQERTRAGLKAARARGHLGGRKALSPDDPRIKTAKALHGDKRMPVVDICRTLQISRPTLYRWLALGGRTPD